MSPQDPARVLPVCYSVLMIALAAVRTATKHDGSKIILSFS